MNIIQIIPGSGGNFYCGNCLRDSKYFEALHNQGQHVVKNTMFLPLIYFFTLMFISIDLSSQEPNKTKNGNLKNGEWINNNITQNSLKTFRFHNRFMNKTGSVLGDVYVKKVNDTIYSSLIIVKGSKVIYEINHLNFWNTKGVDFDIKKNRENFFGYETRLIKEDYIDLGYYSDNGKSVSDDFTLRWNYYRNIFEVSLTP